jgi:hypothetical protein
MMQTIVHRKDGLWSNIAAIVFMLCLAGFAIWIDHRQHGSVSFFVWVICAAWLLFCYIPIDSIRKPKSWLLAIDGDFLVWRVRSKESGAAQERRIPLKSLRTLKFVMPQSALSNNSRLGGWEDLVFIDMHGNRYELPSEFFAGVYRKKIVSMIRERLPNIEVQETRANTE